MLWTGESGRWAALVGIGLGAALYAFLVVVIAQDIVSPVRLPG